MTTPPYCVKLFSFCFCGVFGRVLRYGTRRLLIRVGLFKVRKSLPRVASSFFSFCTFLAVGRSRALSLRRRESTFVLAFSKRTREQAFLSTGGAVHVQSNTGSNTAIWATHPNVGDFTPRRDPVKHEQTHYKRKPQTHIIRHRLRHTIHIYKETRGVF